MNPHCRKNFARWRPFSRYCKIRFTNACVQFSGGGGAGFTPAPVRAYRMVKGFTLPELLVSIAVFVILATAVLANFRSGGYSDDLRSTADELVANLRRAQNLALAGVVVHYDATGRNPTPPENLDGVPAGGYGLSINWLEGYYTMFGDFASCNNADPWLCATDDPCTYFAVPTEANFRNDQYCDQVIEAKAVRFRPHIKISYILPVGNTNGASFLSPVDITFQSPKPIPRINANLNSSIEIELQHLSSGQCRLVTVDTASGTISQELEASCKGSRL